MAVSDPLRRFGVFFAIAFVFFRFSLIFEALAIKYDLTLHATRIVEIIAVFLAVVTGGLFRVLNAKEIYPWLGLMSWMFVSTAFSFWPGGSFSLVLAYITRQLPILLIVGGLILTWKECRLILVTIAFAAIFNIIVASAFQQNPDAERLNLTVGSIGNANDLAAHLLFVLPFLIFMTFEAAMLLKFVCLGFLVAGFLVCVATGSRGGLVAFAIVSLFILIWGPGRLKLSVAIIAMFGILAIPFVPQHLRERYKTLFTEKSEDASALESTAGRTRLFWSSVRFTIQHPLFGVGPGEFSDYEASVSKRLGRKGAWQVTHNAYTQISSEEGIPALLFYISSIIMSLQAFGRIYRSVRRNEHFRSVAIASFCCQLAIIGFSAATVFLSLALTLYIPTMSALALVFNRLFERQLNSSVGS